MIDVKIENWTNYKLNELLDYNIGFAHYSQALDALTHKLFVQAVICTEHHEEVSYSWVQSIIVG